MILQSQGKERRHTFGESKSGGGEEDRAIETRFREMSFASEEKSKEHKGRNWGEGDLERAWRYLFVVSFTARGVREEKIKGG